MVLTSLELVLVLAIDVVYGNNIGIHIEHILFSRKKKMIKIMLLKQQKQNLS